jgi:hypothetical protein
MYFLCLRARAGGQAFFMYKSGRYTYTLEFGFFFIIIITTTTINISTILTILLRSPNEVKVYDQFPQLFFQRFRAFPTINLVWWIILFFSLRSTTRKT